VPARVGGARSRAGPGTPARTTRCRHAVRPPGARWPAPGRCRGARRADAAPGPVSRIVKTASDPTRRSDTVTEVPSGAKSSALDHRLENSSTSDSCSPVGAMSTRASQTRPMPRWIASGTCDVATSSISPSSATGRGFAMARWPSRRDSSSMRSTRSRSRKDWSWICSAKRSRSSAGSSSPSSSAAPWMAVSGLLSSCVSARTVCSSRSRSSSRSRISSTATARSPSSPGSLGTGTRSPACTCVA
jgi:hypothetical protein